MTTASTAFHAECGWCRRNVVNFVNPPAMVEVTVKPDQHDQQRHLSRICLDCYAALIRLISERGLMSRGVPSGTE